MDEFVCVQLRSKPGETREEFAARLTLFWTHMLRGFKDEFEMVYAEATEFERDGDFWTRQYLAEEPVLELIERESAKAGVVHAPFDRDDTYSKYEAVADEWMQIEH